MNNCMADAFETDLQQIVYQYGSPDMEIIDEQDIIQLIQERYPFYGTQIDYSKLIEPLQIDVIGEDGYYDLFVSFFDKVLKDRDLEGTIYCFGDTHTSGAIKCPLPDIRRLLPKLFDIPQFYYLVSTSWDWVIVFTFVGANFGFCPNPND